MCGIGGILALDRNAGPASWSELSRMAAALSHRGPDEYGGYCDDFVGLAHARLSIVDLVTGQQPQSNETADLWIVFNGEIFNYVELREELVSKGHRFRTESDTEVVIHAYEEWGNRAFERFNGQWALALWHSGRRELVLSRDQFGICPLFFGRHAGRLYFGSEVKAIFAAAPSFPRELDPSGLNETLTFWSVVPPQSVFVGVEELRPGHVRTYGPSGMSEECFWQPTFPTGPDRAGEYQGSIEDAATEVAEAVRKATELRTLRADVPVGSYLSGGLDSSLVATLGHQAAGKMFRTFSLRFEDPEYDETSFQRTMVERMGCEHYEVLVGRRDIVDVFPDVVLHTERPVLRSAPAPLLLLSALARSHGAKVVLTGEGADEVFAGYDLFREGRIRRFWAKQPESAWRPRLLGRLYPYLGRSPTASAQLARRFFGRDLDRAHELGFAHGTRWRSAAALERILSADMREAMRLVDPIARLLASLPPEAERWGRLAQDQAIEMRTLLPGYLLSSQGDRMLMGNSVEGRFPFLDKNVVALANSLPESYKLRVLDEKHVLKRAARGALPADVLERKKQPYRAPDALAFGGGGADWVEEMVAERAVKDAGVFAVDSVLRLWEKCRHSTAEQFSNADNMALMLVISTQLLHSHFVAGRPGAVRSITFDTAIDRRRSEGAA